MCTLFIHPHSAKCTIDMTSSILGWPWWLHTVLIGDVSQPSNTAGGWANAAFTFMEPCCGQYIHNIHCALDILNLHSWRLSCVLLTDKLVLEGSGKGVHPLQRLFFGLPSKSVTLCTDWVLLWLDHYLAIRKCIHPSLLWWTLLHPSLGEALLSSESRLHCKGE